MCRRGRLLAGCGRACAGPGVCKTGRRPEPMTDLTPPELPGAFRPKTGTMDAWNAAYVRVEDYLRAHRIHNRLHQARLIQQILERVARRHAADPLREPTTLAAEETEAMMDLWF